MEDLREPEVSKNDITVLRDEDVFGLDVAVDNIEAVERFDGEGELRHIDLDAVAAELLIVP
jgi:hypothetical protein